MARSNYNELQAFLVIARVRSFTRAAAQLGVSQSAFSQTIRNLEARLGVRLLTRTTRSVSLTAAGERLFKAIASHFEEIDVELSALTELRDKPAGTVRITCGENAFEDIDLSEKVSVLSGMINALLALHAAFNQPPHLRAISLGEGRLSVMQVPPRRNDFVRPDLIISLGAVAAHHADLVPLVLPAMIDSPSRIRVKSPKPDESRTPAGDRDCSPVSRRRAKSSRRSRNSAAP